ncbi:hypothetical protein O181_084858 [Austropuccinia psidii MF-1]|uniref:Uncharacterized protein n=1 Tax=Austropuccinia psidii MF-1 TaxID=1389203 RepID=A0A9Q3FWE4_9BASI|nr:hypothetical protein [Austropuccinia psidii MF-1]
MITLNPDHKDYYDPSEYSSTFVSSSNTCAAVSLLSPRDEVFKDMKDVGEDNSISPLQLFHGNVYLPHSSYHESLERFCNREEEQEKIEAMIYGV